MAMLKKQNTDIKADSVWPSYIFQKITNFYQS